MGSWYGRRGARPRQLPALLARSLLVRPGEGGTLLYLTGLNLLLGLGMALGRSSSDALFFKEFGVAYLPHLLFLTSILLVGVSMSYAAIVDRLRPGRLFNILFASFCAFLLLAWIAMRFGGGTLSFAVYYVGYGVMSEILVAHFNFYALGHFDSLQAKRLFPTVGASARLGAMLGGLAMGVAGEHAAPEDMALAWTVMLLLALVLINVRHRGEPATAAVQRTRKKKPSEDIAEGLRFVRTSKLLRFTALGMFAVLVVINVQDYLASTLLTHHYTDSRSLAVFFGWFGAFTNATVLLLQLSTTSSAHDAARAGAAGTGGPRRVPARDDRGVGGGDRGAGRLRRRNRVSPRLSPVFRDPSAGRARPFALRGARGGDASRAGTEGARLTPLEGRLRGDAPRAADAPARENRLVLSGSRGGVTPMNGPSSPRRPLHRLGHR